MKDARDTTANRVPGDHRTRMRTDRKTVIHHFSVWLQAHITFLLVLTVVLFDSIRDGIIFQTYPSEATPWNIGWTIGCVALCLFSLIPRRWNWIGPFLLVVSFTLFLFSPQVNESESDLTYIYSVGFLVSAIGWNWFLMLIGGYCVALSVVTGVVLGHVAAFDVFATTLLGLAFGVIAIFWQTAQKSRIQQEQLIRLRQSHAEEQANLAIAVRLHDHIANDAAGILAISQLQAFSDGSPEKAIAQQPSSQVWKTVGEKAHDIYTETHKIMDLLGQDTTAPVSSPDEEQYSLAIRLRAALDAAQHDLQSEGFHGHIALTGRAKPDFSHVRQEEAIELVHEFATNIARHMAETGTYSLTVSLNPDSCRIVSMNAIPASPITRGRPSGKGLRLHRRLLGQLGGSLAYGRDDDMWISTAVIPAEGHSEE